MIQAALPFPAIDPVLIQLGPVALHWYAMAYIAGLALAFWGITRALRNKRLWAAPPFDGKPPGTEDDFYDLLFWCAIGVLLGGRLGWALFYGVILCGVTPEAGGMCQDLPGAFLTQPWRIIAEWNGFVPQLRGMSFHGGLIGVMVAVWLFCRKRKLNLLSVADLIAVFAPIGLFFGRIANFINGELWGRVTDAPWGMVFCSPHLPGGCPGGALPRHPSQLYEAALEGLLLFIILQVSMRAFHLHRRPGLLAAIFFAGYGLFRFIVEFFREPDAPFLGFLTMGMALSLVTWVAAALLLRAAFARKAA